jgi:RNA polymerase sigma-70 factor (ECF subfamily)
LWRSLCTDRVARPGERAERPALTVDLPNDTASEPPVESSRAIEKDDTAFVAAVLGGDANATEQLVVRLRCVLRFLSALNAQCGGFMNEHDLADLAQDTVVLVWRKLSNFVGPSSIEGWAYGIAHREFLHARRDNLRRGERQRPLPDEFDLIEEESEDPVHDAFVVEALGRMSLEERHLLALRHDSALSFAEMGVELSVPENTAKTRYHRALTKLRELVRQCEALEEHEQ